VETADRHIAIRRDREELNDMIERFNKAAGLSPPVLAPLQFEQH
jgi:hypothetical protein